MDIIEKCNKCKLHECINCEHSWSDIEEIKQKLAEKDKEIENLLAQNKELIEGAKQMLYESKEIMCNIRHQVCQEIRENFLHWGYIGNPEMLSKQKCLEILNQIEGEE